MPIEIYTAVAGAGKTEFCIDKALDAARGLPCVPRVWVASVMQERQWHRRMCERGGYLGVRLGRIPVVYRDCLQDLGEHLVYLGEAVRYSLLRSLLERLPLEYYQRLCTKPGFVAAIQALVAELKDAYISPEAFRSALVGLGGGPRRLELALIYSAYQEELTSHGWADGGEMGLRAAKALERGAILPPAGWSLLIVDGFPRLSPLQCRLLCALAQAGCDVVITAEVAEDPISGPRDEYLDYLAQHLQAEPQPLPEMKGRISQGLAWPRNQSASEQGQAPPEVQPIFVEATDRPTEVRQALRWLKARLKEGIEPDKLAFLARDITPYRALVSEVAREFGLTVRISGGLPLVKSPPIAALLNLLSLPLPLSAADPSLSLPRRLVEEAWRSPYFDWSCRVGAGEDGPVGITLAHADELERAARAGRVIRGLEQWEEALTLWSRAGGQAPSGEEDADALGGRPLAAELLPMFRRFVRRLSPPDPPASYGAYASWVDGLIGPWEAPRPEEPAGGTSLRIAMMCREYAQVAPMEASEDMAALRALRGVLSSLVWAEATLGLPPPTSYREFYTELVGAVEAMSYEALPFVAQAIEVSDVERAWGVSFEAVALVGLGEGEFPAPVQDDPFLPDVERRALASLSLPLRPALESEEAVLFAHALARPTRALLITRPRLADNGVDWAPSPFWEEALSWSGAASLQVGGGNLKWDEICSWSEWLEWFAIGRQAQSLEGAGRAPSLLQRLRDAAEVLAARQAGHGGRFEGGLAAVSGALEEQFGGQHVWSTSRLEAYRRCPFGFFVESVLGLQPKIEPSEGIDARQLGNVYHRLLEQVFVAVPEERRADPEEVIAALPEVAQRVLDAAPAQEGFRETPWWPYRREEIVTDVERAIRGIAELDPGFVPLCFEQRFEGPRELTLEWEGRTLRVHGLIDRVDRASDGRLRVIDYKTVGKGAYTGRAVLEGKKLQLPLYALAAEKALGLGKVAEGFYWHLQGAAPSPFTLKGLKGGPGAAYSAAIKAAGEVAQATRLGRFEPVVPQEGCPDFCAAAAFCWHYRTNRA